MGIPPTSFSSTFVDPMGGIEWLMVEGRDTFFDTEALFGNHDKRDVALGEEYFR